MLERLQSKFFDASRIRPRTPRIVACDRMLMFGIRCSELRNFRRSELPKFGTYEAEYSHRELFASTLGFPCPSADLAIGVTQDCAATGSQSEFQKFRTSGVRSFRSSELQNSELLKFGTSEVRNFRSSELPKFCFRGLDIPGGRMLQPNADVNCELLWERFQQSTNFFTDPAPGLTPWSAQLRAIRSSEVRIFRTSELRNFRSSHHPGGCKLWPSADVPTQSWRERPQWPGEIFMDLAVGLVAGKTVHQSWYPWISEVFGTFSEVSELHVNAFSIFNAELGCFCLIQNKKIYNKSYF